MPNIFISVNNKRAVLTTPIVIVNGNSDYLVTFAFDAEWDDYDAKTLEVKYLDRNCVKRKKEVLFEGSTVSLPILRDVSEVEVGVYAGNLHTTTCALIKCERCISDGDAVHDPPSPDVYDQLLEYLAGMQGGGDRVSVYDSLYGSQVTDSAITGIADLHPKFTCDTGYYFDYEVSCTISGRQYTKKDRLPAIGMIIYTIGYSTPLFISPFESAVAYSSYYDGKAIYSVTYNGLTWYYCDTPCAMGGQYDDSEGHLLTYSGTVNYDSTNNRVTPESVLEILQAVHAQSEED